MCLMVRVPSVRLFHDSTPSRVGSLCAGPLVGPLVGHAFFTFFDRPATTHVSEECV